MTRQQDRQMQQDPKLFKRTPLYFDLRKINKATQNLQDYIQRKLILKKSLKLTSSVL